MSSLNYFKSVAGAWDRMRSGLFSERIRDFALNVAEI
jgi:hypothetical protein